MVKARTPAPPRRPGGRGGRRFSRAHEFAHDALAFGDAERVVFHRHGAIVADDEEFIGRSSTGSRSQFEGQSG